ncbi:insulinase family protein [Rhizobiaceae bacterium BDR2-2]|uniref:Insulinase family protein n=1 Tax=Ectorhizobium quercum TaxID=2965071 RepID=A0AAE3N0X3_9HYPH|nr:insulinase family protein [Ectorhizobium quercum]MCX8997917.1 insulinase family protein [Ectorhizobium quercum]
MGRREGDVLIMRRGMPAGGFRSFWIAISAACVLVLAGTHPARAGDARWDPRLVRGTLENGLSYILHDSGRAEDPFNIRLVVHAGSVDEETPSGVAHIVEHMAFQSTRAHPETLHRYFQALGWRTGVQVNAMTRETETQYMVRTRPGDALDLDGALALVADIAFGAELKEQDWHKERSVILEELKQDDSTASRLNRQKKALLRAGSRFADRPTIGTRAGIEKATVADIRAFYERFYVASNMTLIVSGRFDPAGAKAAIERLFGPAPKKPRPDRSYLAFPLKSGLSVGTVQDPAGTTSQAVYAFQMAMPDRVGEAGQFAWLQKYLLARLIREAVHRYAPHYAATVESLTFVAQEPAERRLVLAFNARGRDHAAATAVLLETVERLRREGLSRGAFETELAAAYRTGRNNVEAAARRTFGEWEDRIASAVLTGSVLEAPEERAERTRLFLDRIDFEDLKATMREMLAAPDRVLFHQVPGDMETPPVSAAAIEAERMRLAALDPLPALPPRPMPQVAAAEQPLPGWPAQARLEQTGTLLAVERHDDPEIVEWALSNGDRVVWLVRDTPDGRVYLSGQSGPGYGNAEFGRLVSQAAIQLWIQSGYGFWTQEDYDRWRKAQAADWNWVLQESTLNAAVSAAPGRLAALLRRYAETVRFGTIREAAAKDFRTQMAESPPDEAGDEEDLSRRQSAPALAGTSAARLEEAARALLAEPVTWFAVGPEPEAAIRDAFARIVGALPRAASLTPAPALQPEGIHRMIAKTLSPDRARVEISFFSRMEWTPEDAFLVSTLTPLAQQALKNRLRNELGGIYTLAFDLRVAPDTDRAIGTLSFYCPPGRAEELAKAALEVFGEMPGIARKADVQRLRADIDFAENARLADPNTWLRRLALSYRRYGDAGYLRRMGQLSGQVTGTLLENRATRIFSTQNRTVRIRLPGEPTGG